MDCNISTPESNAIPKIILPMFFTSLFPRRVTAVGSPRCAACIAPTSRSLPNTLGSYPCYMTDGLKRLLVVLSR